MPETSLPENRDSEISSSHHRGKTWLILGAIVLVLIAGLAFYSARTAQEPLETFLKKARLAIVKKDFATAEQLALRALERDPLSREALLIVAGAVKNLGEFDRALAYYEQISDDGSEQAVTARAASGYLYVQDLRRLTPAESQFRRCLAQDPDHPLGNNGMAFVMGISGQYWELIPYRLRQILGGEKSVTSFYELSIGNRLLADAKDAPRFIDSAPDDELELLCQADLAIIAQDYPQAMNFAKSALAKSGERAKGHLIILKGMIETDQLQEFREYHATLNSTIEEHPELWFLRGMYCLKREQTESAIRCFWESIRRDPNHQSANYQLAQLLIAIGQPEQAKPFNARADLLRRYIESTYASFIASDRAYLIQNLVKSANIAEILGLVWEAYGWNLLLSERDPQRQDARAKVEAFRARLPSLPLTRATADANPALKIDLSSFPLPDIDADDPPPESWTKSTQSAELADARFEDRTAELGINFSYVSGRDPLTEGMLETFEFNGGGVATFDFDGDGWTDLYWTQGSDWPNDPAQSMHLDALYRSLNGERFLEVTSPCGIDESQYSQGVTVGDYNGDGFPDLYIANIGQNRLYENNGDGTFRDITDEAGINDDRWTTSCLMVDLNGDGFPEIYDVNYLTDPDLFTRRCLDDKGVRHACAPQAFSPAADQLFMNNGDGTFRNITDDCGLDRQRGRGLGIVALDLDRQGTLELYVANDVGPNFFLRNLAEVGDAIPRYVDDAMTMGLALNEEGNSESGMGIALGDFDNDLRLDIFVTNFYRESNTLYRQQPGELFVDDTKAAGLHDNSYFLTGFGSQSLDADLDGELDLVIANGHITDSRKTRGYPLQMRPQFYRNDGKGNFIEPDAQVVGDYFQRELLGRGLARLDWNRDGLPDFAVTHLDAPASLLTNTTTTKGHYIALRLIGVNSARDPIGTQVTIKYGDQTRIQQLTAGDGYQASNERILIFGLGDAQQIDELEIIWPAGDVRTLTEIPADREWIALEGMAALIPCVKSVSAAD